jgi:hypothetical protein
LTVSDKNADFFRALLDSAVSPEQVGKRAMNDLSRPERLQIMLTEDELATLDDWRFQRRMPSRAAAVRELLKRGLAAEGVALHGARAKSSDYGVIETKSDEGDGEVS